MQVQNKVEEIVADAYKSLQNLDLDGASQLFNKALALEFDAPAILWCIKAAKFWTESLYDTDANLAETHDKDELFFGGDFILEKWKSFSSFTGYGLYGEDKKYKIASGAFRQKPEYQEGNEPAWFAFKTYAFSLALQNFQASAAKSSAGNTADFALRIGRCFKALGNYESALQSLESAAVERKDDAEILSELADTYALAGSDRESKVLFREAFYISAQKIALDFLESGMILKLIDFVDERGITGEARAEWIPVYAEILKIFSIKRELKIIESTQLEQSTYQLEKEVNNNPILYIPRLINRYFWLLDYYYIGQNQEKNKKREEILLKLKLLDRNIYDMYIGHK